MEELNKFIVTYYKKYPLDMTRLKKIEETPETQEQLLAHVHVIKVEPYSDTKAIRFGLIEKEEIKKTKNK